MLLVILSDCLFLHRRWSTNCFQVAFTTQSFFSYVHSEPFLYVAKATKKSHLSNDGSLKLSFIVVGNHERYIKRSIIVQIILA